MAKTSVQQTGKLLDFIVAHWKRLSLSAAFIIGTIGSFGVTPPYTQGSDKAEALTNFAKFIVAVIIGLMFPLMTKWLNRKEHTLLWGKVAAAALILSIIAFFAYQKRLDEWTRYHSVKQNDKDKKKLLIIGSRDDLRDDVKDFVRENPSISDRDLLQNAAWKPSYVWKEEALRQRRRNLSVRYVLFTPLFAIVMVAVAQVMNCVMSKE